MANIKSQKKRILTNEKRRVRNTAVKSALRTKTKKVEQALAEGEIESARIALKDASRALDIAASKGIVHRNNAANRKSALAKKVGAAS